MQFFRAHVLVCGGTPCRLVGGESIREVFEEALERANLGSEIKLAETGCLGPCSLGPVAIVYPEGVVYGLLTPQKVERITREHLLKGRVVEEYLLPAEGASRVKLAPDRLVHEERRVLANCGKIDPSSLDEYIAHDGYRALGHALTVLGSQGLLDLVTESGLRGRGGAGFPTGKKWALARRSPAKERYLICNADEGEPGTFKDRLIMEGDPHAVIEGMALAAFATGSTGGFIYIRGEYHGSIDLISKAIAQAEKAGLLGDNLFGTDFSFRISLTTGSGAYICGEETALLESMEGKRGEPRQKPPYPGDVGLWGKSTVVNNVETLANLPPLVRHGAGWFRELGPQSCPGTKVFTLTGDVVREGLVEVPMGTSLRELVYRIGGGVRGGSFKLAQTGGNSGGCLPGAFLDLPLDYETLAKAGTALGSGALLIVNNTHCTVDLVKNMLDFFAHESCGQCTPCREGTWQLAHILQELIEGRATEEELSLAQELGGVMQSSCLCGLGQSAPNALLTTLAHFQEEYLAHLAGTCPEGVCRRERG